MSGAISDHPLPCVCVCVCVVIPFTLGVRLVDVPAGVTHEEGHTGFLHLPSAALALIFPQFFLPKGFSRSFPSSSAKYIDFCVQYY